MLTLKHNSLFPILIMVPYVRVTEDISEASYCYYSKRTGGLTNDSCCSIPFLSKWSLVAERKNYMKSKIIIYFCYLFVI